jgi:hypothetical protein
MTSPLLLLTALTISFQPPAPVAAPRQETWKTVQPQDGSFTVEMPGEPKLEKANRQGMKGPVDITVLSSKLNTTLFMAQAFRGIDAPAPGKEDEALDREQKGFERGGSVKILKHERVMIGRYPGRDITSQGPDLRNQGQIVSRSRIFFIDGILYALTVSTWSDKPLPAEADRFFLSFKSKKIADPALTPARASALPLPTVAALPPRVGSTPEEAWKSFLLAWVTHDEPMLREVTLPCKNFEVLLRGNIFTKDQIGKFREELAKQPIHRLKAGEVVTIPGQGKMTLTLDDVSDVKAVILTEGSPVPTRCQKVDGSWKIDARPMIDAQLAAAAREAQKNTPPR